MKIIGMHAKEDLVISCAYRVQIGRFPEILYSQHVSAARNSAARPLLFLPFPGGRPIQSLFGP